MNFLVTLTILILSWSIDSTDPDVQKTIVYVFLAIHAALFGMMVWLCIHVWRRHDERTVKVTDPYTKEVEVKTYWEYDSTKVRDLFFTKIGISAAVSLFVAYRFTVPFPLVLHCYNNPRALYDSEVFQIYILKKKDEGQLARPWKETGVLPEWMQQLWDQGGKDSDLIFESSNNVATGGSTNASKAASRHRK